ncbi:MAG: hypothetical protein L0H26_00150 [Microlunatus sp.]|nr:hypothetical protein [Microlunatus sp.]
MHDYRVTVTGLGEDVLTFAAETPVQLDTDTEPHWTSVQHWTVANPRLAGRRLSQFLDQTAADNGWTLMPGGRRQPTKHGELTVAAEPADWELVLAQATHTAEHYRRVEAAWHTLIADTPLPVVRVGEIAGFGRHRIYQIQNNINGPRGRRRAAKPKSVNRSV